MKNIIRLFSILVIFFMLQTAVCAATLKFVVEANQDFSTEHPTENFSATLSEDFITKEGLKLAKGSVFSGRVIEVENAKRGKRDAYFYVHVNSYTNSLDGKVTNFDDKEVIGKGVLYTPLDMKELGFSAGTTAAGFFVDNIAYPIHFARGVLDPKEGESRLEAGVKRTYEGSTFSYISKGKEINLKKGEKLILVFKYKPQDEQ